ncbi:MAG: hybrid-cluster NAD(P)-dependent oxidoreductase [Deltaproteobacteria bacterium]|nr:hybrid-cluster NAD(P)-dependent oxidoreductase [Deltaproteobacteria bacterium]
MDKALLEVPFRVFQWIAGADDDIDAKEVDVFLRMLEKPKWCKSKAAQQTFPEARAAYSDMWKAYQAGSIARNANQLRGLLQQIAPALTDPERSALSEDLTKLGFSVARASGGFLGIGAASREELGALSVLDEIYRETLGNPEVSEAPPPEQISQTQSGPEVWTKGKRIVRCVGIVEETHDVKTFQLVGEPPCQFSYRPGQACVLEVPIDGKPVFRSYTIASTPSRPHQLELTIKRVPGGLVSNWLADHLKVGDRLSISGPTGKFSCTHQRPEKILFISGGSGITPVMSMSRWMHDTGGQSDMIFFHSARTQSDLIFAGELQQMEASRPNFKVVYTLTRPERQWGGARGRISLQLLRDWVPDFMDRTVYLCGPNPFMEAAKKVLQEAGFDMGRYHAESFGGKPTPPKSRRKRSLIGMAFPTPSAPDRKVITAKDVIKAVAEAGGAASTKSSSPQTTFALSEKEVESDPQRTILELAEDVGISIPNACRVGVCGTCKVMVKGGNTEMTVTDGLEPGEVEEGYALACVARCQGTVAVDA